MFSPIRFPVTHPARWTSPSRLVSSSLARSRHVLSIAPVGTIPVSRWHRQLGASGGCHGGRQRVSGPDDKARSEPICRSPLSARDHQPRGLVIFPLPAEPADGRGDAGRPRHRSQSRGGAAVGAEVWPGVRERDPASPAASRRQVAPRWCVTNTPSPTRVWSCMRDEGGPLEAGSQVQASNHCKLRPLRAIVVSVAAKGGT